MPGVKASYDWDEVEGLLSGAGPATEDEVSITTDGRRLDSAAAVIAFFGELQARRDEERRHG